jgi:tetratricopeptide (TPR) repeat protein
LYLLTYPQDYRPYFYIARPLLMLGRSDEAVRMLEEAWAKNAGEFSIPAQLAMARLRTGRLNVVQPAVAALRQLGQDAWAECIEAQMDFLTGNYSRALERFDSLGRAANPALRARAPSLTAAVYADLGRTADAIRQLTEGADRDARTGNVEARADKLLARASLELRIGRTRACRDSCLQVEQLDSSQLRLARVAALYAQAGAVADAARLLAQLPEESASRRVQIDRRRVQAEILLASGQRKEAWAEFQRAAALEAPGVMPEYLARSAAAAGELGVAVAMYERMATDPGYFGRYPDNEHGRWFDAHVSYLRLARRTGTAPVAAIVAQYRTLTEHVLPSYQHREKE